MAHLAGMKALTEAEAKSFDPAEQKPTRPHAIRDRDLYTCGGCGISDARVECGGIYHCPNPLCTAAGATWSRDVFGFHGGQTATGNIPTQEFLILRGWAERMVAADRKTDAKNLRAGLRTLVAKFEAYMGAVDAGDWSDGEARQHIEAAKAVLQESGEGA